MAQTQTPSTLHQKWGEIDYTPSGQVYAGDVVVVNSIPMVAPRDIAPNVLGALDKQNVYTVPKDASVFAIGDPVYWNATGSPTVGTASTGCATSSITSTLLMGTATKAQVAGDATVDVDLDAFNRAVAGGGLTGTVAATGSSQTDAAVLQSAGFSVVTGANATKGAIIAAGTKDIKVKNNTAAVLLLYPPTGLGINALSTNSAISMASLSSASFVLEGSIYFSVPTVPS